MRVTKTGSRRIEFKAKTDEQKMLYEQKKEELGFKTLSDVDESVLCLSDVDSEHQRVCFSNNQVLCCTERSDFHGVFLRFVLDERFERCFDLGKDGAFE